MRSLALVSDTTTTTENQREMKIAVIENEYGAVSIDTALVQENVREVGWVGSGCLT